MTTSSPNPDTTPTDAYPLELRDITCVFGREPHTVTALDHVSMHVQPGELVAMSSRTGARYVEPGRWERLTGTRGEVEGIALYFEERFDTEPLTLMRPVIAAAPVPTEITSSLSSPSAQFRQYPTSVAMR